VQSPTVPELQGPPLNSIGQTGAVSNRTSPLNTPLTVRGGTTGSRAAPPPGPPSPGSIPAKVSRSDVMPGSLPRRSGLAQDQIHGPATADMEAGAAEVGQQVRPVAAGFPQGVGQNEEAGTLQGAGG
jgi:hypothetical protein